MPLRRTSRATIPYQPATRRAPDTLTRVAAAPLHRAAKLEAGPADNDTGVPVTPSDEDPNMPSVGPARDDTDTEDWADTSASQQDSDEDRGEDSRPDRVPEDIDGSQKIETVDSPPSPADVPEDMEYDPGGEGTPGIMPPVPAPVPDAEVKKDALAPDSTDSDGMDYLLPFGGSNKL
ncbi:MAG: hypothetical protein ACRDS0_36300 [Pseudonocardiaceae bacterium]